MNQLKKFVFLALFALPVVACGKQKAEAEAQLAEIDAACAAGDKDKARQLMLDGAQANPAFKKAFDGATAEVTDKSRVNACGLVLTEVKLRIKNQ
jgi:hypothetical protein